MCAVFVSSLDTFGNGFVLKLAWHGNCLITGMGETETEQVSFQVTLSNGEQLRGTVTVECYASFERRVMAARICAKSLGWLDNCVCFELLETKNTK